MLGTRRQIHSVGELHGLLLRLSSLHQLLSTSSLAAQEQWRGSQASAGQSPRCMLSSVHIMSTLQGTRALASEASSAPAVQQQQQQQEQASQQDTLHPVLTHLGGLSQSSLALQPAAQQLKRAKYTPWVFTRHLSQPRGIVQRMGFLMQSLEEEQASQHEAITSSGHLVVYDMLL